MSLTNRPASRMVVVFVLLGCVLPPQRALAIDLLVYNTNDSGPGSLRQLINLNSAMGGGNTIIFSNSVVGTIKLTSGELVISNDVTVLGPGANVLAVDGGGTNRVLTISNVANVNISGLTITNGLASGVSPADRGGGIYNVGSFLSISACILSGNSAGVGGAIYNDDASLGAFVVLSNCTLSANSAVSSGGAIYNDSRAFAEFDLSTCTLSSNSAASTGGCIYNIGHQSADAEMTLTACTLSGNAANNAGGIFNMRSLSAGAATVTIGNTILNAGSSGSNIVNSFASVVSQGYNLSSDNGGGFLTNVADQINTDPKLGPLRDNGGPTPTMALLPNSSAIDKGKSFGLTTDQRGAPRPFDFASIPNASGGDGSDIGAFESGRPKLNIEQAGGNAVLSWPWFYGDFTLQSSTNLTSSDSWVAVGGSAVVVGARYQQTNAPIAGNRFFRLRQN